MKRRDLLSRGAAAFAGGLAVGPAFARKVRIGFLGGSSGADPNVQRNAVEPFRQALRERGRIEGPDLTIEFRWAEGRPERLPDLLAELLRLDLDLLVTMGPRPAILARDATRTLPVVAIFVDNPVDMGLAESFARPGRNITGVSGYSIELVAKRLELMKQLVPAARRVGILMNPITSRATGKSRPEFEAAVRRFEQAIDVRVLLVEASAPEEFEAAFESLSQARADGVLVLADATFYLNRARLAALCEKHRLPSIWGHRDYLDGGGLASYQSHVPTMFQRGAHLVDAILRGANPAETPFEQSTRLELVVNLKAARALGITVPPALLVAADELLQ